MTYGTTHDQKQKLAICKADPTSHPFSNPVNITVEKKSESNFSKSYGLPIMGQQNFADHVSSAAQKFTQHKPDTRHCELRFCGLLAATQSKYYLNFHSFSAM